jgi:diadenosine tetraphosphate (Ap4A) HIT family hydrolase
MSAVSSKECGICQSISGAKRLNQVPRVMVTKNWVVEHIYPTSIKGWMIMTPKRHVTAVHQLNREEMAEFGELMHEICTGQHEIYKAEKEYFMQFSEAEGFNHLNIHVVPRLKDWPDEMKGPNIFTDTNYQEHDLLTPEEIARESMALQNYLLKHLPARILR